jgi:hypothetical protein
MRIEFFAKQQQFSKLQMIYIVRINGSIVKIRIDTLLSKLKHLSEKASIMAANLMAY